MGQRQSAVPIGITMLAEFITLVAFSGAQVASSVTDVGSSVVGRTEIVLRDSDVVTSRATPLEYVVRVSLGEGFSGARVDAAVIELTLDVDGDATSFVPFVLVAESVVPDAGTGEYVRASSALAREPVQQPAAGQRVHMMAAGIIRYWAAAGQDMYLRVYVDEPAAFERAADSIRLVSTAGNLGKIVVIAR